MAGSRVKKVLLIGWDAADWQMIHPLIQKGWLPTLSKLIEEGVHGNLATIQPMLSPMLWNSIATGKRADRHGICGFLEPRPDRSGVRPVSSTSRQCKAIWNILSQRGLRSNVVSWFASHPAEPINGAIVTDRYPAHALAPPDKRELPEGVCHPTLHRAALAELLVTPRHLDAQALLPFVPGAARIDQDQDDRLIKLAGLIAQASSVQAATCHLMREESWDFTAVYFGAIDQFGHSFMPYHPPRMAGVSEEDAAIYGEVMTGCYRFHDMMLEALLATAGADTTVILVSDHGFLSGGQRPGSDAWENPEHWHRPFGVACLSGPGIRRGETLYGATLLDVTPTILSLFGLPVGDDMDGRPWLEVFSRPTRAARIASWEQVEGDAGLHPENLREDPVDAAEAIRQLVELGYVEAPGEDVEETLQKTARDEKLNLAVALSDSRRAAEAIALWEELAEAYPEEEGFLVQLARCLVRLGRVAEGRRTVDRLSDALRSTPVVRLLLATIALEQHDPEGAVAEARSALADGPVTSLILNRAGEIFLRTGNWRDAGDAFGSSLAMAKDNPVALDGLAQVWQARGEPVKAVEHALQAVGLAHFFPGAHYHLGEALQATGQTVEAVAAFETCLGMGFKPRVVHQRLAKLLEQDDPDKARQHAWAADHL